MKEENSKEHPDLKPENIIGKNPQIVGIKVTPRPDGGRSISLIVGTHEQKELKALEKPLTLLTGNAQEPDDIIATIDEKELLNPLMSASDRIAFIGNSLFVCSIRRIDCDDAIVIAVLTSLAQQVVRKLIVADQEFPPTLIVKTKDGEDFLAALSAGKAEGKMGELLERFGEGLEDIKNAESFEDLKIISKLAEELEVSLELDAVWKTKTAIDALHDRLAEEAKKTGGKAKGKRSPDHLLQRAEQTKKAIASVIEKLPQACYKPTGETVCKGVIATTFDPPSLQLEGLAAKIDFLGHLIVAQHQLEETLEEIEEEDEEDERQ
jgi:hypothetical protein